MKKIIKLLLPIMMTVTSFALTGPRIEIGGGFQVEKLIHFASPGMYNFDTYATVTWQHKINDKNEINFGPKFKIGAATNFTNAGMTTDLLFNLEYGYTINKNIKYLVGIDTGINSIYEIAIDIKTVQYGGQVFGGLGVGLFTGVRINDSIGMTLNLGYSSSLSKGLYTGLEIGYKF